MSTTFKTEEVQLIEAGLKGLSNESQEQIDSILEKLWGIKRDEDDPEPEPKIDSDLDEDYVEKSILSGMEFQPNKGVWAQVAEMIAGKNAHSRDKYRAVKDKWPDGPKVGESFVLWSGGIYQASDLRKMQDEGCTFECEGFGLARQRFNSYGSRYKRLS